MRGDQAGGVYRWHLTEIEDTGEVFMTVQEAGTPSLAGANWPPGVEFDLVSR